MRGLKTVITMVFMVCVILVNAQDKKIISGRVLNQKGEPIVNATIRTTSNVSTSTDNAGMFTIQAGADESLTASFQTNTVTVRIEGKSNLDIILNLNEAAIDEVVVVGYGTQKKSKLLGSVSTIDAKQLDNRPVTNVSTALSGLASGVQVKQSSGRPGGDGATIRVRGVGTLNNSDALVVIDGIVGSMDNVNPNDIEKISILKDASSAAIYGTRSANGVILITTKTGKANQKTQFNYSGILSRTAPMGAPEFVSDYVRHMELFNEAKFNIGSTPKYSESTIEQWRKAMADPNGVLAPSGLPNYIAYPSTDWAEWIYNNKWIQSHNISATGGSENTSFMLSGRLFDNPGIMNNSGSKKHELRTNFSTKVGQLLRIGTNSFASIENRERGGVDNLYNYLRQTTPGIYPYYDNRFGGAVAAEESVQLNNLLQLLDQSRGMDKISNYNTTIFADVNIIKGLTFETKLNYQARFRERTSHTIEYDKYSFASNSIVYPAAVPSTMSLGQEFEKSYTVTFDNVLRYNIALDKHNIGALVGHNEFETRFYDFSASKRGLIDPGYTNISTGNEMSGISGNEYVFSIRSFFGRLNYDYDGKYLFEFSLRNDGTSKFGEQKQYGYFPSLGLGWILSRESFMKGLENHVQNVKLRASWGKLGNDRNAGNPSDENYLPALAFYGKTGYSFGGTQYSALEMNKFGNPYLGWEETTNSEIALEFGTFKNRLTTEVNYYKKVTRDILTPEILPLSTGNTSAPIVNSATMDISGLELNLRLKDQIGHVKYIIGGNFAYNKSMVSKLKGKLERGWGTVNGVDTYLSNIGQVSNTSGTNQRILEDHLYKSYFVRQTYKGDGSYTANGQVNPNGGPRDGMIRTESDYKWAQDMIAAGYKFSPLNSIGAQQLYYGDFIYADLNGDKTYGNDDDRDFTGTSDIPKYVFGFNLGVEYKGFDVQMLWSGEAGLQYYWNDEGYNNNIVRDGNAISKRIADDHYFYNPSNPSDPRTNVNGTFPRLKHNGESINNVANNFYLYDADFVKLRNIQIGFTFNNKITEKLRVRNLRLYFSGENLLMFTKFPGADPEIGSNSAKYPTMKQYAFGLNFGF